jgi:hypothetical protein
MDLKCISARVDLHVFYSDHPLFDVEVGRPIIRTSKRTSVSARNPGMVGKHTQIRDLGHGEFWHYSERYSRSISSAASRDRRSEEYINSE